MKKEIHGSTGIVGIDGLLTPDQSNYLNRLQESAANSVLSYLGTREPKDLFPMVAMATGIGKGNIIHRAIEKQIRQKPDSKILIVAGTKLILVKQTHEALAGYQEPTNGEDHYVESEDDEEIVEETTATDNPLEEQQVSLLYRTGKLGEKGINVQVATIQSIQSEIGKGNLDPENYDLVIVDEVHNIGTAKRKEAIQQFDRVIGFTATPHRHSGYMKSPSDYGFEVIESLTLPEAQEMHLLPPLLGIQIDTKEVADEIPTTTTGKIDFKKLEKILKNSPELRPFIADRIAQIICDEEGNKYKTVIAVNFVWEAEELAKLLHDKGIKVGVAVNQQAAKQIHTDEIPALDTIERYKLPENDDKSLQVLISPYVASEGFDAPFTEILVWASPTDSQLRYTQYTGRLARRAEGKRFGVVVDCLYQTEQYGWSYNMGMWMKGDVRQLENGMLWLGPETDIEELKNVHSVQMMSKHSDRKPLEDLQEEIENLKETDFSITGAAINEIFIGGDQKLLPIAKRVLAEIQSESPALVVKRRNRKHIISAITDPELFIRKMVEHGAKLKDSNIEKIKDTDFAITVATINKFFVGRYKILLHIVNEVLAEIQLESPELVVNKKTRTSIVKVINDPELFKRKMVEHGAKLKDSNIEKIKDTDLAINRDEIIKLFIGDSMKLLPIASEVLTEIQSESSALVVRRKSRKHIITVVTDQQLFMKKMVEHGVKLKDTTIEELKDTDFSITGASINEIFIGGDQKLLPIAKRVLAEIQSESPKLVIKRKNGHHTITIVTDQQLFIRKMQEHGAKLRDTTIEKVKETDFSITVNTIKKFFVGDDQKLLPIAKRVLAEIQSESPKLVVGRKSGASIISAVTDPELFKKKMVEHGVKLKDTTIEELKDTDFSITGNTMRQIFVGGDQKLLSIANQVLSEIQLESPELIVRRKSRYHIISAITDTELFKRKMQEHGAKLKELKSK